MGRIIILLFFLVLLGFLGLIGYAYSGWLQPEVETVTVPIEVDVD